MIQRESEERKGKKRESLEGNISHLGIEKNCHSDCFGFQVILHVICHGRKLVGLETLTNNIFLESLDIFACLCHVLKERIADPFDKVGKNMGGNLGVVLHVNP